MRYQEEADLESELSDLTQKLVYMDLKEGHSERQRIGEILIRLDDIREKRYAYKKEQEFIARTLGIN